MKLEILLTGLFPAGRALASTTILKLTEYTGMEV